ncbi:hypothetical protein H4582DRAFT_1130080 [Lactarius indigo]|nr:hypothetical protein H4582DRAFT_1130080 [Lactarius indigo]
MVRGFYRTSFPWVHSITRHWPVHTSTPVPSPPPASTPPLSTTGTRFPPTISSDSLPSPSPRLHFASEPVITTSSPEHTTRVPTSSSSSLSRLPPTQKAEPSVHSDVVLSSPSNPKDVPPILTSSSSISSSTLSSKSFTTDISHLTTTSLSSDCLWPTKCQLAANEATLTNVPSATITHGHLPLSTSASSLFAQDYNTKAYNSISLNTPSPQPSLSLDGIPRLSSTSNTITSTSTSPTLTLPPGQTPTSVLPLTDGGKNTNGQPVKTTTSLSSSLLVVSTPPGSKTTSVTTFVLSTSVTSSSVLKTKTTDSIVTTDHPAGAVHTLIPSDIPQKNQSKPEPPRPSSSDSLPPDSTSFPGEVGRIAISTASSPSLSTTSFITSTTTTTIPSLTSVDGVRSAPFSKCVVSPNFLFFFFPARLIQPI